MSNKVYCSIFLSIFFLAIFFSFFKLTESPPFWYDEGIYFQTAVNISKNVGDGIQLSPGNIHHFSLLTVGYPLTYPLAFWFEIFGISIFSARSLMVLFIMGFLITSYVLARKLFKNQLALGSLLLLATLPTLYGNGKSVLGEVPGLLYMTLFFLCINIAKNSIKNRNTFLIIAGMFAGLCIVTKPIYILILPAIICGFYLGRKSNRFSRKELIIWITFFILPIITWLFVQFGGGDSFKSILGFYANPYNKGSIILKVFTNFKELFYDVGTLYTLLIVSIWTGGLLLRKKLKKEISAEEIIAFIFSVLVILAFLRIGGIYRYIFPAQAIALIFFPKALFEVVDFLISKISRWNLFNLSKKITSIVIIILVLGGIYQVAFDSWVAEAYKSNKTAFWKEYFIDVPESTSVFFYDTPEVAPFILHNNYYQFLLVPAGKTTGPEQLSVINLGIVDKIIVEKTKYENSKSNLFKLYEPDEEVYKYTILKKVQ